ncbi:hypothetical protein H9W90_06510 [Polaribacter pectinis]|uniref:Uncharacterized protein n=1 Tax=Polaribacter pectinis TaxID=2738844 RepID=A0A7G9LDR5_9FLAO|nr:hypothetical protein [Polaribacter pectinis]QNM86764.1 hypothetical protein H9W90_06510 [Polaribacter pectinis]
MATINFRISDELKNELQFIAQEKEIKVSRLVREIITEYIEEYYSEEDDIICLSNEENRIVLELPNNYNNFL